MCGVIWIIYVEFKYTLGKQTEDILNILREPLYSDICINLTDH